MRLGRPVPWSQGAYIGVGSGWDGSGPDAFERPLDGESAGGWNRGSFLSCGRGWASGPRRGAPQAITVRVPFGFAGGESTATASTLKIKVEPGGMLPTRRFP